MRFPLLPPHLPLPLRKWPLLEQTPDLHPGHPYLGVDFGNWNSRIPARVSWPSERRAPRESGRADALGLAPPTAACGGRMGGCGGRRGENALSPLRPPQGIRHGWGLTRPAYSARMLPTYAQPELLHLLELLLLWQRAKAGASREVAFKTQESAGTSPARGYGSALFHFS